MPETVSVDVSGFVRVDLGCRAHTFPAKFAIALVESLQYAIKEEEPFEVVDVEDEKGNLSFEVAVGNEIASGRDVQEAVISFWQMFVSFKKTRR